MLEYDLYRDIIGRTGGDIYLGVVGPVRTGKSTFIRKSMELFVLPNIEDINELERVRDELPQGSAGKTIMTTEPKFVPDEAVEIEIKENLFMRFRFVDCVGYAVPGAVGYEDEEGPRMVSTPWFDYDIPFQEASELGTRKVITEHSTIGIVVTSDGSITEIPRENYLEAEERVINELKEIGKPFVILLNSTLPQSEDVQFLRDELADKYEVPVIALNLLYLKEKDINIILEEVLYEFPVRDVFVQLPDWVEELETDHWLRKNLDDCIQENLEAVTKVREVENIARNLEEFVYIEKSTLSSLDLGLGEATINVEVVAGLFQKILSEYAGEEVTGDADILHIVRDYSFAKKEYDKMKDALDQVRQIGYGIVPPVLEEMSLDQPEIIRHGGRFGVRLKASAPSVHMIRVDVKSEVAPVVGSERQSEDLVNYLVSEFEENPEKLWESQIFGKSLHELVKDGITSKLGNMPPNAQEKLQQTLEKIVNEGSGGLIAIIL
ncbi:MAG: stage IV sporulation protein A [Dethiobacteria bacterium]